MPSHAEKVREIAELIALPRGLLEELACLAIHLDESPEEVLAEALSELRSLRWVFCDDPSCRAE